MNEYGESDVKVYKEDLNYALDGDLVLVELNPESEREERKFKKNKDNSVTRIGRITQILKRDNSNVVGEIKRGPEGLYFEQFEKKEITFILDEEDLKNCYEGDIVSVEESLNLGKNRYTVNRCIIIV